MPRLFSFVLSDALYFCFTAVSTRSLYISVSVYYVLVRFFSSSSLVLYSFSYYCYSSPRPIFAQYVSFFPAFFYFSLHFLPLSSECLAFVNFYTLHSLLSPSLFASSTFICSQHTHTHTRIQCKHIFVVSLPFFALHSRSFLPTFGVLHSRI